MNLPLKSNLSSISLPAQDGFPVAFASRCPAAIYSRPDQPGVLHLVAEKEALLSEMREELDCLHPWLSRSVRN